MLTSRLLCTALIGLLSFIPLLPTQAASGTVTDCSAFDDANVGDGADTLAELLPGGGIITFGCNGTIVVPEIVITAATTLDATGRNVTLSGGSTNRIITVLIGVPVTLNHLTLRNGQAGALGTGGAIYNEGILDISGSVISGNGGFGGGGISNNGTLNLINSTVSNNSVIDTGGGIYSYGTLNITNSTISRNSTTNQGGGGIYNGGPDPSTISNSTISDNQAGGDGGGLDNTGNMTITNSTISTNSASFGGGLTNSDTLTIVNSTVSNNFAGAIGGNVYNSGTLTIGNTILANNASGADCSNLGTILPNGANLVEDNSCGFATLTGDPRLAPLAANGGPTRTHGLLAGSAAIDAGSGCPPPATDQRGVPRPGGVGCDLGAFEGVVSAPAQTMTADEPAALCDTLADRSAQAMTASPSGLGLALRADGSRGSVYCHIINIDSRYVTDPSEIGHQTVIDGGVVQAVDVFGLGSDGDPIIPFATPMTVCMRGTGTVQFLSATSRQPQQLKTESSRVGYTCASVPSAGTVVLVNVNGRVESVSSSPVPLTACRVTTLNAPLNLRTEPSINAAIMAKLPTDLTLTATERVMGWYRVIYLDTQGWLSANFLSVTGDCG
jgi:hypothetical protein